MLQNLGEKMKTLNELHSIISYKHFFEFACALYI